MNSILLDTSFCIRLLKRNDALHQNAVDYFKYFLDNKIEMHLSSIVIAEYSVKDDIGHLPLSTMKIVPFDFFDGKTAGEFYSILMTNRTQLQDVDRLVVKDDCKLIAQVFNRRIDAYITKDRKSFNKIINPLLQAKSFSIKLLDLEIPLKNFRGQLF